MVLHIFNAYMRYVDFNLGKPFMIIISMGSSTQSNINLDGIKFSFLFVRSLRTPFFLFLWCMKVIESVKGSFLKVIYMRESFSISFLKNHEF